jgi:hypothetical protein
MTAEHAHALDAGGEYLARVWEKRRSRLIVEINLDPVPGWGDNAEDHRALVQRLLDDAVGHYHPTVIIAEDNATAADAVLAEARRLCCGENPSAHHAATDKHSELMAFAGRLAGAVRQG